MVDRKIILKATVGSHLYGTSTPESDTDYSGIFLPSTQDMLGLGNCPTEWIFTDKKSTGPRNVAGDTDCKYYSLRRFMSLATEGQPGQLELLFLPDAAIASNMNSRYLSLVVQRDIFLSRNSISPFIGFAMAQAHKAVIKGDNLTLLRKIQEWGKILTDVQRNLPLSTFIVPQLDKKASFVYYRPEELSFSYGPNDHGFPVVTVAGRSWDHGIRTKLFLSSIEKLLSRYGTRSEAAAEQGYDYKSLSHAYRLLSQAEEFLTSGSITFPRPDAAFLLQVRRGEYKADHFDELNRKLDYLRQEVIPTSVLPEQPDRAKIEKLCIRLHREHLG